MEVHTRDTCMPIITIWTFVIIWRNNSQFLSLHRNLVQDKSSTDPSELARLVEYVRSQVKHMDKLDSEHILTNGHIQLLPFSPNPN